MNSASHYMRKGLAKSTLRMYESAWSHFTTFSAAFSVPVMPVNIPMICAFIVHCFQSRKMQPSSIKASVAGIQFHLRCADPSISNLLGHPSIRLLFQGLNKEQPRSQDKRLPFSLTLIHKMVTHLRQGCFGAYTDSLLEALFFTAFYGFLRCSEFTTSSDSFNPLLDPTISDITIKANMYSIHLKHSKTDKEGKGSTVTITQTNSAFCPLSSMIRYLQQRPHSNPNEPLFLTDKGRPASRSWFTTRLRLICQHCDLPPHLFTSHSFRIGAATTAAKVVPASTVKAMGRWSSSAFERYVRPENGEIVSAQKAMSKTLHHSVMQI